MDECGSYFKNVWFGIGECGGDGCRPVRADASKQQGFGFAGGGDPQVPVGQFGGFTPPGRAFEEPFLDEERFVDLLDCAGVFADGRGDGIQPDGAPAELFDDGAEYLVVHLVEAARAPV